jgi:hypothetical protein
MMANWMICGAEKWLLPLATRMETALCEQDVLQVDEPDS